MWDKVWNEVSWRARIKGLPDGCIGRGGGAAERAYALALARRPKTDPRPTTQQPGSTRAVTHLLLMLLLVVVLLMRRRLRLVLVLMLVLVLRMPAQLSGDQAAAAAVVLSSAVERKFAVDVQGPVAGLLGVLITLVRTQRLTEVWEGVGKVWGR